MERILILFVIILLIFSCDPTIKKTKEVGQYNGQKIDVIEIDSCEYLMFCNDLRSSTHKGNCKYCNLKRIK